MPIYGATSTRERPTKKSLIGSMMVLAKDVPTWAGYFRKPGGTYVYLRMAPSTVKYHGLNTNRVYGVCFTGNIVVLNPLAPVVLCDVFDMARNIYGGGDNGKNIRSDH